MEEIQMIVRFAAKLMAACSSGMLIHSCVRLYEISKPGNERRKRGEGSGEVGQKGDQDNKSGCESCDHGFYRELACARYRMRAAGILCLLLWFNYFLAAA